MELRDYLKLIRRRWVSICAIALVCVAIAVAVTLAQTKQYASSVSLFVSTTAAEENAGTINAGGQFSVARVQSYVALASSRQLASSVIDDLRLDVSAPELAQRVTASATENTVNMSLTVRDVDPQQARRIAQAYAEALVELVRTLETPPGQTTAPIKATIVDNASYSSQAVTPQPVRNTGLGVVLGLALGLGIAVLRRALDTRVQSADEVSELTGKSLLGAIPYDSAAKTTPLISSLSPHAPRVEAFRVLRTNLQFVDVDSHQKVFVITSAMPGEGKTATSANLAISLTQAGVRILLIEGDLRRPRLGERLGLDSAVGVTSVLVGKVAFEDAVQRHEPTGLEILFAGPLPPNPAELLQSQAMHDLIAKVRSSYDVVLIDAPPLLPVTDAALLARHAEGAIIVMRHGKVSREQVRLSVDRLAQVDARLVGVVMNMLPAKTTGYGYGYANSGVSE